MTHFTRSLAALAATLPILITTAANAQDGYDHTGRVGATFGLGLGGGTLSCSNGCEDLNGAGSFDIHLGGMLGPNVAFIGEVWWMYHTANHLTVDQGLITGALRFWPVSQLWLQGGLGIAQAGYTYDGTALSIEDHSEWVPAFTVALGVEPIASDTFALDIALRYGTGFYSDGDNRIHSLALTVGVSFY
ncbi:MAG: hypothetical protein U1F43_22000 [Myxococcota bacterium]